MINRTGCLNYPKAILLWNWMYWMTSVHVIIFISLSNISLVWAKRCNKGILFLPMSSSSTAVQQEASSASATQDPLSWVICLNIFSLPLTMSIVLKWVSMLFSVFSKTFSNGGTVNLVVQGNIFQMMVSRQNKLNEALPWVLFSAMADGESLAGAWILQSVIN